MDYDSDKIYKIRMENKSSGYSKSYNSMKDSIKAVVTSKNDKNSSFKIKRFNNDEIFNDTSYS